MPAGTYPDTNVEECKFVALPTAVGKLNAPTTSELIKEILRGAASEDGFWLPADAVVNCLAEKVTDQAWGRTDLRNHLNQMRW